jgi:hypothetical protein
MIRAFENQPLIRWVSGDHFLGVKRLKRDADHSSTSSVEVVNRGAIPLPCHIKVKFSPLQALEALRVVRG